MSSPTSTPTSTPTLPPPPPPPRLARPPNDGRNQSRKEHPTRTFETDVSNKIVYAGTDDAYLMILELDDETLELVRATKMENAPNLYDQKGGAPHGIATEWIVRHPTFPILYALTSYWDKGEAVLVSYRIGTTNSYNSSSYNSSSPSSSSSNSSNSSSSSVVLTRLDSIPTGGYQACHAILSPDGHHLYVGHYLDGRIAVFECHSDGRFHRRRRRRRDHHDDDHDDDDHDDHRHHDDHRRALTKYVFDIPDEGDERVRPSDVDVMTYRGPCVHGLSITSDGRYLLICEPPKGRVLVYRTDDILRRFPTQKRKEEEEKEVEDHHHHHHPPQPCSQTSLLEEEEEEEEKEEEKVKTTNKQKGGTKGGLPHDADTDDNDDDIIITNRRVGPHYHGWFQRWLANSLGRRPRHMAIHPSGRYIFFLYEFDNTVTFHRLEMKKKKKNINNNKDNNNDDNNNSKNIKTKKTKKTTKSKDATTAMDDDDDDDRHHDDDDDHHDDDDDDNDNDNDDDNAVLTVGPALGKVSTLSSSLRRSWFVGLGINAASEIAFAPSSSSSTSSSSSQFLYVSNRGIRLLSSFMGRAEESIATLHFDETNERLTLIETTRMDPTVHFGGPRHFLVLPSSSSTSSSTSSEPTEEQWLLACIQTKRKEYGRLLLYQRRQNERGMGSIEGPQRRRRQQQQQEEEQEGRNSTQRHHHLRLLGDTGIGTLNESLTCLAVDDERQWQ